MSTKRFESAFTAIFDFLNQSGIRYALIGAWANNVWGKPRGTIDIDFLILMSKIEFKKLMDTLSNTQHFKLDHSWAKHNPMIRHFQQRILFKNIPIDLMLPRDEHDHEILKQRKKMRLLRRAVFISSPEDTILQKLKVGRPRDFEDAVSIIKKHKDKLNHDYLNKWATTLNIYDELSWLLTQMSEK